MDECVLCLLRKSLLQITYEITLSFIILKMEANSIFAAVANFISILIIFLPKFVSSVATQQCLLSQNYDDYI